MLFCQIDLNYARVKMLGILCILSMDPVFSEAHMLLKVPLARLIFSRVLMAKLKSTPLSTCGLND